MKINLKTPAGLQVGQARFPSVRPMVISDSDLARHTLIAGGDARSRRTHMAEMLAAQTRRGGGWVYIDSHDDVSFIDQMHTVATDSGRLSDFFVIDLGDPARGNSYNPLLAGAPKEIAQRVVKHLLGDKDVAAGVEGADWTVLLETLFEYAERRGAQLSLATASIVLEQAGTFFPGLAKDPLVRERLERMGVLDASGQLEFRHLRNLVQDLPARLDRITYSGGGHLFSGVETQTSFRDVLVNNKMCVVRLGDPLMKRGIAQFLVEDLVASFCARSEVPHELPGPTFMFAMDRFDRLLRDHPRMGNPLLRGLAWARSCRVGYLVGTKELRDVSSGQYVGSLWANTFTKIVHAGTKGDDFQRLPEYSPELGAKLQGLDRNSFLLNSPGRALKGRTPSTLSSAAPGSFRVSAHPARPGKDALHLRAGEPVTRLGEVA